jgi:hypothetical protein
MLPGEAEGAVGFIDCAVGVDANAPFLDALACGEACVTGITCTRIDLVKNNHEAVSQARAQSVNGRACFHSRSEGPG